MSVILEFLLLGSVERELGKKLLVSGAHGLGAYMSDNVLLQLTRKISEVKASRDPFWGIEARRRSF